LSVAQRVARAEQAQQTSGQGLERSAGPAGFGVNGKHTIFVSKALVK
jgi:hypothetical protein